jgi:hypothetical protein
VDASVEREELKRLGKHQEAVFNAPLVVLRMVKRNHQHMLTVPDWFGPGFREITGSVSITPRNGERPDL